jgi:hypothetical protein
MEVKLHMFRISASYKILPSSLTKDWTDPGISVKKELLTGTGRRFTVFRRERDRIVS